MQGSWLEVVTALPGFFLRCMLTTTAAEITPTRARNVPPITHGATMNTRFSCDALLVVGNSGVDISASEHKIPVVN